MLFPCGGQNQLDPDPASILPVRFSKILMLFLAKLPKLILYPSLPPNSPTVHVTDAQDRAFSK